ncbi:MAG: hypothetical protein LBE13_16635 [Bacteroidales bacterium]|jgi:hypothetical protein|nr:hypothetical protein [Bacteroidales bacterium]
MKNEQQSKKESRIKKVLASMSTKEKKAILLTCFIGLVVMFVVNILKIILK